MSRFVSRGLTLTAVLGLAACSLGPDFTRPNADPPAKFRAASSKELPVWPDTEWWRGFDSPPLDFLIASAQTQSPDIAAAVARVRQADAQMRIAGAGLLPNVGTSAQASWQQVSVTRGGRQIQSDVRQYSTDLNIGWELDLWGRNRALADSAQATALASRFNQQAIAISITAAVAQGWFNALGAQDQLNVARRNVNDAEQTLRVIRGRFEAGTNSALDVAQQESLVAGQRAQIPNYANQVEQFLIGLGILTGQPPSAIDVRPTSGLAGLRRPAAAPGLPSELLARRPDVAEAEANLSAVNADIRAARAAFFPTIRLTGSTGLQSAALSSLLQPGALVASLAAGLTQPIFDGGTLRGQLALSQARQDELLAAYRKAVLQALTDVDAALTAVQFSAQQERLQREAVARAQRAADIARAQLAAGTVDITTVLQVQTTLYAALNALILVRQAHFQARVALFKALGGGWNDADLALPELTPGRVEGGFALPIGLPVR